MIYTVSHRTTLSYAKPVADARFNLRLSPMPWPSQQLTESMLTLDPMPARRWDAVGPYLVNTTRVEFDIGLVRLEIHNRMRVEIAERPYPGPGPALGELRRAALTEAAIGVTSPAPYLFASRLAGSDEEIGNWAAGHVNPDSGIVDAALALSSAIHSEFAYEPGVTTSSTPPSEAFAARHGVCQDFAHIFIIGMRWLGLPAAYASGYLRTLPPPGQPKLVGADAMHAWANVWCGPELGWIGVDPTNDCLVSRDHVQIAMGRDYADVAPIDGVFLGAAPQAMKTAVDVDEAEPVNGA